MNCVVSVQPSYKSHLLTECTFCRFLGLQIFKEKIYGIQRHRPAIISHDNVPDQIYKSTPVNRSPVITGAAMAC